MHGAETRILARDFFVARKKGEPILRKCPCGEGHYAVIHRSYPRNFLDRWEMHCTACAGQYQLYSHESIRKGRRQTQRGWVPRRVLSDFAAQTAKVDRIKSKLTAYALKRFGRRWHAYFAGKPRITVWRELTENGKRFPGLAVFYKDVHHSSLEVQLNRYFDCSELPAVIRILGIKNAELERRLAEVERLQTERRRQESEIQREMFE